MHSASAGMLRYKPMVGFGTLAVPSEVRPQFQATPLSEGNTTAGRIAAWLLGGVRGAMVDPRCFFLGCLVCTETQMTGPPPDASDRRPEIRGKREEDMWLGMMAMSVAAGVDEQPTTKETGIFNQQEQIYTQRVICPAMEEAKVETDTDFSGEGEGRS